MAYFPRSELFSEFAFALHTSANAQQQERQSIFFAYYGAYKHPAALIWIRWGDRTEELAYIYEKP